MQAHLFPFFLFISSILHHHHHHRHHKQRDKSRKNLIMKIRKKIFVSFQQPEKNIKWPQSFLLQTNDDEKSMREEKKIWNELSKRMDRDWLGLYFIFVCASENCEQGTKPKMSFLLLCIKVSSRSSIQTMRRIVTKNKIMLLLLVEYLSSFFYSQFRLWWWLVIITLYNFCIHNRGEMEDHWKMHFVRSRLKKSKLTSIIFIRLILLIIISI